MLCCPIVTYAAGLQNNPSVMIQLSDPRQTRHRQGDGVPTLLFQLNHNETALQWATCATLLFTLLCYKAIRLICDNTVKSEWQTPASIVHVMIHINNFKTELEAFHALNYCVQ